MGTADGRGVETAVRRALVARVRLVEPPVVGLPVHAVGVVVVYSEYLCGGVAAL